MRALLISLLVVLVNGLISSAAVGAHAQRDGWSEPVQISSIDAGATGNSLVADHFGFVHLVWSEQPDNGGRDSINYARFDGETWTAPVDIYVASGDIDQVSLAIDQHDTLHLAWTEGGSNKQRPVYYSTATSHNALSARNWSTPTIIDVPAFLIRLQVDTNDIVHLIYSKHWEPSPGVYHIRAEAQRENWSASQRIDLDGLLDHAPEGLQFAVDDEDNLHVVWFYVNTGTVSADWVRYARSPDGGETWSWPYTIDKEDGSGRLRVAAGPILAVNGKTIHVIWAAGKLNYRHHRYSLDAGVNWSEPVRIFGDLNGQAKDSLVVDAQSMVHFFGQIRYPQGIYHAYWDQNHWTEPEIVYFIQEGPRSSHGDRIRAHFTYGAIRAGSQLVLTFGESPGDTDKPKLFVMHKTAASQPTLPVQPIPLPSVTSSRNPNSLAPSHTPVATSEFSIAKDLDGPMADIATPVVNLWLGIIPPLAFLGLLLVFRLARNRKRHY